MTIKELKKKYKVKVTHSSTPDIIKKRDIITVVGDARHTRELLKDAQ